MFNLISILIGTWFSALVVGWLHGAKLLPEPTNPILHTFQDWILLLIVILPISYLITKLTTKK